MLIGGASVCQYLPTRKMNETLLLNSGNLKVQVCITVFDYLILTSEQKRLQQKAMGETLDICEAESGQNCKNFGLSN